MKLGAHIISNSFACTPRCFGPVKEFEKAFEAPGVTYVVAAGDKGYGTARRWQFGSVVSVGGTILSKSGSIYSEIVWPDTRRRLRGESCQTRVAARFWLFGTDSQRCGGRRLERRGVRYLRHNPAGSPSAAPALRTPIIAGVFGLAGNATKQDGGKIFWTLSKKKLQEGLHVISSGNNGCPPDLRGSYLCTAGTDEFGTYSGPTGWGTPNGIGAF